MVCFVRIVLNYKMKTSKILNLYTRMTHMNVTNKPLKQHTNLKRWPTYSIIELPHTHRPPFAPIRCWNFSDAVLITPQFRIVWTKFIKNWPMRHSRVVYTNQSEHTFLQQQTLGYRQICSSSRV